jgi:hypothetical protein
LPKCKGSYESDAEVGTAVIGSLGRYQGARVDDEEVIRSQKVFKDDTQDKVTGVALLVQDHTGRVTDKSYGEFDSHQKSDIAFKQAQMFLLNYKKSGNQQKKEIYIRTQRLENSNKIYAALLLLKHNDPTLEGLVIKPSSPRCEGPKYNWYTSSKVSEQNFIKKHLDPDFLVQKAKLASDQSAHTRKVLYAAENTEKGKNVQKTSEQPLKNMYEGDEITAEGNIKKAIPQVSPTVIDQHRKAKSNIKVLLEVFEEDISDIKNDRAFRVATELHKKLKRLNDKAFIEPIDFDALKLFSEQSKIAIDQAIPLIGDNLNKNYLDNLSKEIGKVMSTVMTFESSQSDDAHKKAVSVPRIQEPSDENISIKGLK